MIIRRNFEATRHPKGSEQRKQLNGKPTTSEYYPTKMYIHFTERWGTQLYATLAEAQEAEELYIRSTLSV